MSLNWDTSKCSGPAENPEEKAVLDLLIWMSGSVGISEITKKTAPEFYARLHMMELLTPSGGFLHRGDEAVRILPRHVARWIGLETNAMTSTRAQWIKTLGHDLDDFARRYSQALTPASIREPEAEDPNGPGEMTEPESAE